MEKTQIDIERKIESRVLVFTPAVVRSSDGLVITRGKAECQ